MNPDTMNARPKPALIPTSKTMAGDVGLVAGSRNGKSAAMR